MRDTNNFQTNRSFPSATSHVGAKNLVIWREALSPAIASLRRMAGTTEDEFLQIGSQMQMFYLRSEEISRMSNQLVEVVSGDSIKSLTGRLQQMMTDMEAYLAEARNRSSISCGTLERIKALLGDLSEPMEGFHKMNKALRMLCISTKIESARLGEMGSGFVNLAMDVEKLSHQVNERCTQFGATVSAISAEVTNNISEVVSSMQMHDMTRQQVEHIVEALERLFSDLTCINATAVSESPAVVASDWPKITLNCCRHLNILLHRQLVETLNLPCFGQARVQQSLPMNFVKTVTKSVSARFGSYWISLATVCSQTARH